MKALIRFQMISVAIVLSLLFYMSSCEKSDKGPPQMNIVSVEKSMEKSEPILEEPSGDIIKHAKWQCSQDVTYDPSYYRIPYPSGDVPADKGVCIDVVIRAFRSIDVDFQKLIHEDMAKNMSYYGVKKTDTNIDHRRCKNAIKYFRKAGKTVPVTSNGSDYKPGDLVFWDIAAGHVGIVTDVKVPNTDRYYVVHNICCGPKMQDFLFSADIVEHVRW